MKKRSLPAFVCLALVCAAALLCAAALPEMSASALAAVGTSGQTLFTGDAVSQYENGKKTGEIIDGRAELSKETQLPFAANLVLKAEEQYNIGCALGGDIKLDFDYLQTLSGSVTIGEGEAIRFSKQKLLGNEIQFSLSREKETDTTTGYDVYLWTVRVNGFSLRLPIEDGRSEMLDSLTGGLVYTVETDKPVLVEAAGGNYLYDYLTYGDRLSVRPESVNYSSLVLTWTPPEGYAVKGFVIQRYNGGVLERTAQINSGVISSLAERYLEQGTKYTYLVKAYDEVNIKTRPCPKLLYVLDNCEAVTEKGNFWVFFGVVAGIVAAVAAVIVLYTFRYTIFKGRAELRKKQKNKRGER